MRFRNPSRAYNRAMQEMIARMHGEGLQLSEDGSEWVPIQPAQPPNEFVIERVERVPPPPTPAPVIDVEPPPLPTGGVRRIVRSVHEILTERNERAIGAPIGEPSEQPSAAPVPRAQARPLTAGELRIVARSAPETGLRCPFCLDPVGAQEAQARCEECGTLYHGECWKLLMDSPKGRCATLGCASTRAEGIEASDADQTVKSALELLAELMREGDEQIREGERLIAENRQRLILCIVGLALLLLWMATR